MNGGEIKKEVGETPTMGCYVRLTLVAISVLCRHLVKILRWLIQALDLRYEPVELSTAK